MTSRRLHGIPHLPLHGTSNCKSTARELRYDETAYVSATSHQSPLNGYSSSGHTLHELDQPEGSQSPYSNITSRPVSLYGGSLSASVYDSQGIDSYPSRQRMVSDHAIRSRPDDANTRHSRPTCLEDHAEERARRLAFSFTHMHIDRTVPSPSIGCRSSRSLTRTHLTTHAVEPYFPGKNYPLSLDDNHERTLANERMGLRLQRIYAKPVKQPQKAIKIRSRWELAEADRHREIHRLNGIVSRKITEAKKTLPPCFKSRTSR